MAHAAAGQWDAYVVLDRPGSVGETVQVRRRAAKVLPDYMVPVTVTAVPALPLTVNGKLDADRLPGLLAAYLAQRVAGADTTTGEAQ